MISCSLHLYYHSKIWFKSLCAQCQLRSQQDKKLFQSFQTAKAHIKKRSAGMAIMWFIYSFQERFPTCSQTMRLRTSLAAWGQRSVARDWWIREKTAGSSSSTAFAGSSRWSRQIGQRLGCFFSLLWISKVIIQKQPFSVAPFQGRVTH